MDDAPRPRRAWAEAADTDVPSPAPTGPRRAAPEEPRTSSSAAPAGPRRAAASSTRRRRWPVALVVLVLLTTVAAGLCVLFSRDQPAASPKPEVSSAAASPSPSTPAPEPSPSPRPAVKEVVGDAVIQRPQAWELYHDEMAEGDRRLIRIRDNTSGVRLQVTTLAELRDPLDEACQALASDQAKGYAVDHQVNPRTLPVSGSAQGLLCGFEGTREGDDQPTSVLFTLIRRAEDRHTLIVRQMDPSTLDASSRALSEASAMTCAASQSFGHALPLCSPVLP